ncbi:MAG: benzoate-CoA ligase family protein [Roseitalea porphyridii]|uniref:benzoate-CoA ligase family protein n=1 Tax=Roseitalea porphyridii TaxID=1852022 RepID=UPI0032D8C0B3
MSANDNAEPAIDGSGNAAVWFVDRHIAGGRADKTAFREAFGAGRAISYGELSDRSARFASACLNAGLRREERAIMLVLDQIEFPVIFWGALKAGIVPIPLNTLLSTSVYDAIFHDSRASALFVSSELYETIAPALPLNPFIREVIVIGDTAPDGARTFDAFMEGAEPSEPVTVCDDEVAFWLYSSGSTGQPKGVRHVHASLKATADTYGAQVLGVREEDSVYSVAKMFFAYGLGNAMTFPMAVGATTLLYNGRPTPDSVTQILAEHKPTVFCGVPTLYAALVHKWESEGAHPDAPLATCISAGEALPEEVGRKWRAIWGVDIMDGVGSTEMLHIFLSNRPGDVVYGTSGVPVPGYEVRLVDEHGADVGVGAVGELLVRGASSADGYWNQRDKTRSTFEGHWTRTGDKYELTAEGRYVYCGRTDDMFKVSGIWVSPFEVEQALVSHPAVLEAAVVAKRDADGLEKPKAFIVLKSAQAGCDPEELKTFVQDKIGKWKYPRWIETVDDLPKTATGKIQRFKLREVA